MRNIFNKVQGNPLFGDISFDSFDKTMSCLTSKSASYKNGDTVWLAGTPTKYIGLLMTGSVRVSKNDEEGNTIILSDVIAPSFLGEIGVLSGLEHFPVTVKALCDCDIFFLDKKKATTMCSSACRLHAHLVSSMLHILAKKALMLDQKVEVLTRRTIREKILRCFDMYRGKEKKFTIPFSREEMAQFLCVNRTALSDELSKMRDEGLIKYKRNEFEIL